MQTLSMDACNFPGSHPQFLGFRANSLSFSSSSPSPVSFPNRTPIFPCISCTSNARSQNPRRNTHGGGRGERPNAKGKDNVWSVDNDASAMVQKEREKATRRRRRGRRVRTVKRSKGDRVMISQAMLMEVERVLQTQEPVIRPAWNTFASSVSGIWKGVGAVFSPITAEMEPIDIGNKSESLYDCYTLSCVEAVPPSVGGQTSQIQRKINWVTLNPYGEMQYRMEVAIEAKKSVTNHILPKFESFDFGTSDVMEEDIMGHESGLVFFEDGSYSRGPVEIPVGELDESKYYLSPTFKFEQCLVKGCHKRLRIVHTIEFSNGGSDIRIMRVAVYEEQWVSLSSLPDQSDLELDSKPFSQRKRTQPSELTGSWKVFEVSATPVFGEEMLAGESNGTPYVYLCTETLKKRSLPENSVYFGEEEMLDMQDVTVLWLPGGVTGYVDVNKEGVLCIGVGWYSDEGINLVMERDYGIDGKLKEVRWKTEVKRRWSDPIPL
ncbi:uncharacterized protein LOC117932245 [Vitis riparia]|uniref:uncharacterized protein LOC117932245 n=1 Tax=Vitis riparia TaxID=96939 RepID=UPI00155A76AD|nr:uncharacterized protein LOC117932245 [Vitis riparia]